MKHRAGIRDQTVRVRIHREPASTNRPASAIMPQVPSAGTDGAGGPTVTLTEMSPESKAWAPSLFMPSAWIVNVSVPEKPVAGAYLAFNPEKVNVP